jgi:hypothetical protein
MPQDQLVQLYLQLTSDIRSLWFGFGGLTVVVAGWLLSRKRKLDLSQRLALTIGWLGATGYLGSSLMNRYRLTSAVVADIKGTSPQAGLVMAIAEASPLYEHYSIFVWGSLTAICIGALLLIWSNIAVQVEHQA